MNSSYNRTIRDYAELAAYTNQICVSCKKGFSIGDKIHVNNSNSKRPTKYYHLEHWEALLH